MYDDEVCLLLEYTSEQSYVVGIDYSDMFSGLIRQFGEFEATVVSSVSTVGLKNDGYVVLGITIFTK